MFEFAMKKMREVTGQTDVVKSKGLDADSVEVRRALAVIKSKLRDERAVRKSKMKKSKICKTAFYYDGQKYEDSDLYDLLDDKIDDDDVDADIDEVAGEVHIGNLTYSASEVLRQCDPTAYSMWKSDMVEAYASDGQYELDRASPGDIVWAGPLELEVAGDDEDDEDMEKSKTEKSKMKVKPTKKSREELKALSKAKSTRIHKNTEEEAWDKAYDVGTQEAEERFARMDFTINWSGYYANEANLELGLEDDDGLDIESEDFTIDLRDYFGSVEDCFDNLDIDYYADEAKNDLKDAYVDAYASRYADEHMDDYLTDDEE